MKKMISVMLALTRILSLLTGCKRSAKRFDDNSVVYMDESISNFLAETELQTYYGEHWQVKIDKVIKVETDSMNYYLYTLLIAPIYQERLALASIECEPCEYIEKTYSKQNYMWGEYFNNNKDHSLYDLSDDSYLMDELNFKHQALRAELCLTNISNVYQKNMGLDDARFDEYMRDIVITIKCDFMKKDRINVHYDGEIAAVSDYTSNLYRDNAAVRHIMDGDGYPGRRVAPFKDEFYPLSKDIYYNRYDAIREEAKNYILSKYRDRKGDYVLLKDTIVVRIGNQEDTVRGISQYNVYPLCCGDRIIAVMVYDSSGKTAQFIEDDNVVSRFSENLKNGNYICLTEYNDGIYLTDESGYILICGKSTSDSLPMRIATWQGYEATSPFSFDRLIHVIHN